MTMSKAWSKVIIFEYHYMVLSSENAYIVWAWLRSCTHSSHAMSHALSAT